VQPTESTPASEAGTPATPTNGSPAPEDNALVSQLIAAMRDVAERERGSSLATLQESVREATEALNARSASSAEELRKHSDDEISGIGEWVKLETQRVAAEGDRKIEARRQQLSQQLTDHEQRSQREVERLNERFAEYERELASFFAQLNEITDPAAFGAAAKRMPRPPTLTDATPGDASAAPPAASAAASPVADTTATATAEPATASKEAAPSPSQLTKAESTTAETTTAEATAPEGAAVEATAATSTEAVSSAEPATETQPAKDAGDAEAQMVEEHRSRMDALGLARDDSASAEDTSTSDVTSEATASDTETTNAAAEDSLRSRLAQLDETLGKDAHAADTEAKGAASSNGTETATAIVVHGLGSFGAITSFKQALERVDGVHGISLSLGPTGEFVYRATHDAGFDLVGAIEGIESSSAQIDRQPDGSLRVNVQRSR
jgi:hypothetical protein